MKFKQIIKLILDRFSLLDLEEENRKMRERQIQEDLNHPERLAVLPYCTGRGIDVGCGNRKTTEDCIGVDVIAKGETGQHGSVAEKQSQADICASGDNLHMFGDGKMDFVVSRHNLEHYVDVIKTLSEWKRVLKKGGVMAIVTPDERSIDAISLDPTHKHAFTPESLKRYIDLLGGLEVIRLETVIENWSFLCVCRKK